MSSRTLCFSALLFLSAATALAQAPALEEIVANQNRTPAGKLENGVLSIQLELRNGAWRAEADDGPQLFVSAFAEVGRPAQIPGPMMRVPAATTLHVTVANKLKQTAAIYGLNTRPGNAKAGITLTPGETREFTFPAGEPGTYYYWARTTEFFKNAFGTTIEQPLLADAYLNGAYIVDPVGAVPADRVFVVNAMVALADVLHEKFEVVSINGKSYPYTEPLEYTEGESIRWRVINPSFAEHPMHLHGAFYHVLSLGDFESDTAYADGDRQSVVTQDLTAGRTMMLEWKPEHPGRWLFHCHFQAHVSSIVKVPVLQQTPAPPDSRDRASPPHVHQDAMATMIDMAGLVLVINVKAAHAGMPVRAGAPAPRKLDLVVAPNDAAGKSPTFSCSVRDGKKIVTSEDKAMGPPIVVTRGQATEITVVNQLQLPTSIHWHGLELDSYYDGVVGGGTANRVTPAIAPGSSFVARFTPNRAGTFIYHTHVADSNQLSGGVYGAIIVLEPGESFDPEHDRLIVLGTRDEPFAATRITINGAEDPSPMVLTHGVKYRLRMINIAPNLVANFQLGNVEHPATWHPLAKDGATLPPRLTAIGDATLHITSGETYDFEVQWDAPGEIPLQVENNVNKVKLVAKVVVQ